MEIKKTIEVTAPVRIDISAGWSDANTFKDDFGGAVLNGAINWRVKGTLKHGKLTTSLEKVPANSGLGTSGALRTVYLVCSNPNLLKNKNELIKRVNIFENAIVGQRAGFQDQAAAVYGGVNYFEFKKDGAIAHEKIVKSDVYHLQDRLLLVYTGEGHISANVHQKVFESRAYVRYVPVINRMRVLALKMYHDVGNERKMACHIQETWELQKRLHKEMETPVMKAIQEACGDCMLAGRATGAGGGGCFLLYMKPSMRRTATLRINQLRKQFKGMKILPFEFCYRGIEYSKF